MLTIFILGLGLDLAGSVSSDQNPILQVFLCRMLKYLFDPVSSRSVRLNHFWIVYFIGGSLYVIRAGLSSPF